MPAPRFRGVHTRRTRSGLVSMPSTHAAALPMGNTHSPGFPRIPGTSLAKVHNTDLLRSRQPRHSQSHTRRCSQALRLHAAKPSAVSVLFTSLQELPPPAKAPPSPQSRQVHASSAAARPGFSSSLSSQRLPCKLLPFWLDESRSAPGPRQPTPSGDFTLFIPERRGEARKRESRNKAEPSRVSESCETKPRRAGAPSPGAGSRTSQGHLRIPNV